MKKVIIIVLAFTLFTGCKKYAEGETFLIPENYEGPVVIVFDQKEEGSGKNKSTDRYIYHVPKSGILYSQFSKVEGVLDQKFYYIDENNVKKKEIHRAVLEKNLKANSNYILDQYDGNFTVYPKGGIKQDSNREYSMVNYMYFIIGKPSTNKDSLRGVANNLVEQIRNTYPEQIK